MSGSEKVVIVGGGVAGLSCGQRLHQAGVPFTLLEGDDKPGGRVRTDEYEGFLLDRGFQVLLTAYPEARRSLDYNKLGLCAFTPGALIRSGGKFHRFVDPWRQPLQGFSSLFSPIGSFADKLRIAKLRSKVCRGSLFNIFHGPERSTLLELRELGFSPPIIEQFFRPFFGGVFLDSQLETSSRMLNFVFRMFSSGNVALPADGIGQIAKQLAMGLPKDSIQYKARVQSIEENRVSLTGGEEVEGAAIVLASGGEATARLVGKSFGPHHRRAVTCLYFRAQKSPLNEPILVLNGEGTGPVNNFCVPSLVSRRYAPPDQHLLSVTVLDDQNTVNLETAVLEQMRHWFGDQVKHWSHLRTYRIEEALPHQIAGRPPVFAQGKIRQGLYLCGDFCTQGSLNAAMYSGRLAAEEVAGDLAKVLV
ncbi:MAG: NAD(P)/FAD-dependent oxidoreductase [Planctomycetota bacterium]|nr:NAD(P)/FAD-dependent oxidoreductase [Planctomycetota bacterium]